jgi:hypothetical protein
MDVLAAVEYDDGLGSDLVVCGKLRRILQVVDKLELFTSEFARSSGNVVRVEVAKTLDGSSSKRV